MKKVHRAFWLTDALSRESDEDKKANSFRQEMNFDMTILGGGMVGMWTAINLKKENPEASVCILEKDICGGGASGRNGGFVLSYWPKISSLIKLCGLDNALKVVNDSVDAIEGIKKFFEQHGIDIHFKDSPWLWTATSNAQMNSWQSVLNACQKLGVEPYQNLTPEQVGMMAGSNAHRAGVLESHAATVHPGLLARGLRKVAKNMGVEIFEGVEVQQFSRTNPIRIKTSQGALTTKKFLIANNAWAANIPELASHIVAITSDMILTAPCEDQLKKIGWFGQYCITDSQTMVNYYHVTKDYRVAFGKGGWGIAYKGNLGLDFDRNTDRAKIVESDFRRYYPMLDVEITHDWCGPIDRTPTSLPYLGSFKKNPNIYFGIGWSGNGVGPSFLGGKILASMILEQNDYWANHPLIGKPPGRFPPEPIRYIGAHMVRSAVATKERYEIDDLKAPFWANQLAKLAPAGLEDK